MFGAAGAGLVLHPSPPAADQRAQDGNVLQRRMPGSGTAFDSAAGATVIMPLRA
jgi:hypothetical protein